MNINVVTRYIGIVLLLNALFMLISAIVSALYDFDSSFSPLILSAMITFMTGFFPLIFVKNVAEINIKEGFTIVVFSWILSCLFGMLPYILYGGEFSIINSWYESVSGYTTTGATILTDVENLPKDLLFWRSSTHWLGGVVLFMLLLLPTVSSLRMKLNKIEISSLSQGNYRFKAYRTIRIIAFVYIGLTLLETILLIIAGMNLFDAVNHSFSTIATGGFSTKNLSIRAFDSASIEIIIMVFMLLSGMHFGLLYGAATGKSMNLFKSPIIRYYVISTLAGGLLVSLDIKLTGTVDKWGDALRDGFFQVISCGTTTGFGSIGSLGNYSDFPALGKFVLSIEMLLGRLEIYPLFLVLFIHKWR
ncbi:MAG: potassium transporter TrkG [Bacteroidales bacterium]